MSADEDMGLNKGRADSALSCLRPLEGLSVLAGDSIVEGACRVVPEGAGLFLVGGALRNIALGAPRAPDYDFAFDGDTRALASLLSRRLGGSFFALDEEAGAWRVVVKGPGGLTVDLTPLAPGGIIADLGKRDFTLNALAVAARDLLNEDAQVIDPFGGLDDARAGLLRKVSDEVFDDDPARLMRAARLATRYGLVIEDGTRALMAAKAPLLANASAERAREELAGLMDCPDAHEGVALLHSTGLLRVLVPETAGWGDVEGYDLMGHSLAVLGEADRLLGDITEEAFPGLSARLKEYLLRPGPVSNGALFRLAALFHDFGKAYTLSREGERLRFIGHDADGAAKVAAVMDRLRFGKKASSAVSLLVKNHHRVFMLAALERVSPRARGHFFRVMGGEPGVMLVCLSLADSRATRGGEDASLRAVALDLMRFYYDEYSRQAPGPLMTGEEAMATFEVDEGPEVGEILRKIGEGVEAGEVTDKDGAVAYVRQWLEAKSRDTG